MSSFDLTEFYLTSMWSYRTKGVDRILEELRSASIPNADFHYDQQWGWFRVNCPTFEARKIQKMFQDCQGSIEQDVGVEEVVNDDGTVKETLETNAWIEAVKEGCAPKPGAATHGKHHVPEELKRFASATSWDRLENGPGTLGITSLLVPEEIDNIQQESGTTITWDLSEKLLFIGGDNKKSVEETVSKLEAHLQQMQRRAPATRHYLYAESTTDFQIDVRYAAHINPTLLTCTIFDPASPDILDLYRTLYHKGACLRICVANPFADGYMSFFGPKSPAIFPPARKRRDNEWFRNHAYNSKDGLVLQTYTTNARPKNRVETWVEGVLDATSSAEPEQNNIVYMSAGEDGGLLNLPPCSGVDGGVASERLQLEHPRPAMPLMATFKQSHGRDALQPEDTTLATQCPLPAQHLGSHALVKTRRLSEPRDPSSPGDVLREIMIDTTMPTASEAREDGTIVSKPPTSVKTPHRALDTTSTKHHPQPTHLDNAADPSRALVKSLVSGLRCLVGHARATHGKLQLRMDLGRILVTNFAPEGLAFNQIRAKSNGWTPHELIERLNNGHCSSDDITFTKLLSIYGNDVDYMAKLKDDEDRSIWTFEENQVTYEFYCRIYNSKGPPSSSETFIIDINSDEKGEYMYSLRHARTSVNPLWIHCLYRHWDVQAVLDSSHTLKLENSYGLFAQSLLGSLAIKSDNKRRPWIDFAVEGRLVDSGGNWRRMVVDNVRARHISRFSSRDRKSYLDLTQVEELGTEQLTSGSSGVLDQYRARPKDDISAEGRFSVWHEASISSVRAEALFRENEILPVGNSPSWTVDSLEAAGCWEALYGPALSMVKKMDGVGVLVDNCQQKHGSGPSSNLYAAKLQQRQESQNKGYW